MSRRIRPRGRAALAALGVLVVALSACGIPEDAEPREISRENLPPELVDPASTQPALDGDVESRMVTLYLVRANAPGDEELVAVPTEIPRPQMNSELPRAVVEALLAARPAELGQADLVNALSASIQVLAATIGDDDVLDLDLSDLGGTESSMQRLAVAQLVFTLAELTVPRIDAVRFSVDGEEVAVPVEGAVIPAGTPVRPSDDPSLMPATTLPR
ncbi:MAG TPA: GerMN domain-containing protein [Acidimicrobiales bacterium]